MPWNGYGCLKWASGLRHLNWKYEQTTVKSFLKCEIINTFDGTEDFFNMNIRIIMKKKNEIVDKREK